MIDFIRVWLYPSVGYSNFHKLPKQSGIYYLRLGSTIEYIGQSKSIRHRWMNDGDWKHKQKARIERSKDRDRYRLHYRPVAKRKLDFVEYSEIHRFKPEFNVKRLDPQKCLSLLLRIELLVCEVGWMLAVAIGCLFAFSLLM